MDYADCILNISLDYFKLVKMNKKLLFAVICIALILLATVINATIGPVGGVIAGAGILFAYFRLFKQDKKE